MICLSCSNGCRLDLVRRDARTVLVRGNRCLKGVAFAYAANKDRESGVFVPAEKTAIPDDLIARVLDGYGLTFARQSPGLFVQGSPERVACRIAVCATNGETIVVEQLHPGSEEKKREIARRISLFAADGVPVIPYLRDAAGVAVRDVDGLWWQAYRLPQHTPLDRATYWQSRRRGEVLASTLDALYASAKRHGLDAGACFSLPRYVDELLSTIETTQPELFGKIEFYVDWLRCSLFAAYDSLPQGFCHGDPHPMNVLWNGEDIAALIDFEFSGVKPRMYDAALVAGCIGAEAPAALGAGMLSGFFERLTDAGALPYNRRELFWSFVAALRFAWLSEWLRREDEEMIGFELFYVRHLKERSEAIR
jgi:homoserine kinase type II